MRRPSILLLLAMVAFLVPTAAEASVVPMTAGFESGTLNGFTQTNMLTGSLTNVADDAYTGSRSLLATYAGGGANGYTRGVQYVAWGQGDDVWYRAAFKLPAGFKAAMQGQVALLRWDDWESHPTDTDHGGIVVYGSTKRAYLVRERLTQNDQRSLVGPFDLPEDRWFLLDVHQHFSSGADALSEVYLDGERIGSSTAPNLDAGRSVERLRTGVVAIASGAQTNPLALRLDDAAIATSGPALPRAGTPAPAPVVTVPPVTSPAVTTPVAAVPAATTPVVTAPDVPTPSAPAAAPAGPGPAATTTPVLQKPTVTTAKRNTKKAAAVAAAKKKKAAASAAKRKAVAAARWKKARAAALKRRR